MASSDKPISEFPAGTLTDGSLFATADIYGVGYNTSKHSAGEMSLAMCGNFEFDILPTTSKNVFGAINEMASSLIASPLAGLLPAGYASVTINSESITANTLIDVYTDKEGLNYNSMSITDGSVTLTYDVQETDTNIQLVLRSVAAAVPEIPKESYIYNVGQTAFNTGYIHNANTKVVTKVTVPPCSFGGYANIFGARNGGYGSNSFGFFTRFNDNKFCGYRTGNEKVSDAWSTASSTQLAYYGMPIVITAEGNNFSWYREDDPNTVQSMTATGTVNDGVSPMAIFGGNGSNSATGFNVYDYAVMTLFWFEIYENDTLLHRYIPAYNNNQYCLYDEVEETYLYDVANSGNYIRGVIQA